MPPFLRRPAGLACFALCGILIAIVRPSPVFAQGAYVVADATSGHVLEARGQRDKRPVASLTKVATALVVLDWCELRKVNLGEFVTVPAQAIRADSTNPIGFQPGDRMTIRDLIFCMMLQSDNIAAEALAIHVGSQLPGDSNLSPLQRFVQQMNALARSLRMDRTLFLNPNGIDNVEQPYSTALDMARLTKTAISKGSFRFFVTQKERRVSLVRAGAPLPAANTAPGAPAAPAPVPGQAAPASSDYLLRNTNELLGRNEIDGVKTGQTNRAGGCLIISATKPPIARQLGKETQVWPRKLIVVVLGSPDRFNEALGLLQRGWTEFDTWSAQGRKMEDPKREL